jgi:hypothetical protein
MADLTDAELPGYCETHCRTERALFHSDHLNRLLALAGYGDTYRMPEGWHTAREDAIDPLVKLAQERMKEAP